MIDSGPLTVELKSRRVVMQVTWSLVAGGSEIYAMTILSGLDSCQFNGMICGMDQGGALEEEIHHLGVPVFVMNRRPGIDLKVMWRMYRLFRSQKVDVVQTHHFNQLFYSAVAARLAGARLIHTEHDVAQYSRRRLRIVLKWLSVLCHKVVVVGDEVAKVMRDKVGIMPDKIVMIPAGVNLNIHAKSRQEARRDLSLHEDDRIATIVARLYPEKNHKLLLAAFAHVAKRLATAKLLIVGEGIEEEAIRAEIERLGLDRSVKMMGVRRDIPQILAASDVFVLSSDREGLPIVVLEAMAASRPVVATAVGDMHRVVQDGVNGRLVPPGNADELANALAQLLMDRSMAERMGAAGRRMAEQNYSRQAMIDRHCELYC